MRASILLLALGLAACGPAEPPKHLRIPGADRGRGEALVLTLGCGACHVIPGVGGAIGRTGPPLAGWSGRSLIAGRIPNTPQNLVAWLLDPPALEPRTAMPALGLEEAQARDVAAFLYGLGPESSRVEPPASGLDPADIPRSRTLPGRGPFVSGG
ncbi:c-type cytochrome [Enterovirga sp.]|jgi:cytochrome c|uniref:c-type cytochrome n=1 Tax=Enterovirga sp. TaxID=2026350 RepID=UPI00260477E3|nr:c-type cytochrome [Enterovirga sp.]MDB5590778.1 hypothetical protein [Enterovirga sp.]